MLPCLLQHYSQQVRNNLWVVEKKEVSHRHTQNGMLFTHEKERNPANFITQMDLEDTMLKFVFYF